MYLDELVELFEYCRPPNTPHETKFIWCHAGISRRIVVENLPYWLDSVLRRFEGQVYIDLSWVVYEDYILKDLDTWAQLVRKYPTSFMLGSDVVGGGENLVTEFRKYKPLLDKVSQNPNDEVRQGLAGDNFVRLMADLGEKRRAKMAAEGLKPDEGSLLAGLVLKPEYEYDEKAHTGDQAHSFILENKP